MAVFVCPACNHTQDAPDAYIGRTAKCLKCETKGSILDKKPAPPPNPPKPKPAAPKPQESKTPKASTDPAGAPVISKLQVQIIIGLLSALLIAQLFGLTSTGTSTTEWEYTIESPSDTTFQMALDRLGGEGWELVFARRATSKYSSASYEMIFKRPKR